MEDISDMEKNYNTEISEDEEQHLSRYNHCATARYYLYMHELLLNQPLKIPVHAHHAKLPNKPKVTAKLFLRAIDEEIPTSKRIRCIVGERKREASQLGFAFDTGATKLLAEQ